MLDKRIVLVCGKGGVGRTTVTAALGMAAARAGKRVMITEIGDPEGGESPLAHLFGRNRFAVEPCHLEERLQACHLWAQHGHGLFLRDALPGGALIAGALRSKALNTFLNSAPSFLEMGWFNHLLSLLDKKGADGEHEHELIFIDMPATGHALALTSLPNILLRMIKRGPIKRALEAGQAYLNNPDTAAAWVVTLPETLPVSEAVEMVAGLRRTDVPVGGVILNRYPVDPFTPGEREELNHALDGKRVLGALGFHKVERSREAAARLEREVSLPVIKMAEMDSRGGELAEAVARAFLGADTAAVNEAGSAPPQ